MDFTREPIIETVITPREGCTLVIRSSKGSGQEEYFVDALEVVIFGNAIFFRSRERPKAFLVPATDYEVLEVRETRLILKNVGLDRSIKIAGGREAALRTSREPALAKAEFPEAQAEPFPAMEAPPLAEPMPAPLAEAKLESRFDKKRDRRRTYRRRRGREEVEPEAKLVPSEAPSVELPAPELSQEEITASTTSPPVVALLSSLLAPPPTLISETIARYKDNALFKGAFFLKEEEEEEGEEEEGEKEQQAEEKDLGEQELYKAEATTVEETPQKIEENEEIQLPSMSLDYPVYMPHERRDYEAEEKTPQKEPEEPPQKVEEEIAPQEEQPPTSISEEHVEIPEKEIVKVQEEFPEPSLEGPPLLNSNANGNGSRRGRKSVSSPEDLAKKAEERMKQKENSSNH